MREEVLSVAYSFRYSFVGLAVILSIIALSTITAALGKGTVVDSNTPQYAEAARQAYTYDSVNNVTNSAHNMADASRRSFLAIGAGLYDASAHIHTSSVSAAKTVGHMYVASLLAVRDGTVRAINIVHHTGNIIGQGARNGAAILLHMPGNIISSLNGTNAVSALIRPGEDTASSPPVIDAETSTAILEHLGAEQRAKIAQLLEEQKAANRQLVGTIIAGDPSRGGYPAKWDNARQDSLVDSWGMYNRECVSYAAWKVYQTYGHMPYWGGVGNANLWVRNAKRGGIPTSATPKPQSVAISMRGYYGHAMWVEKVAGDMIYVSQYNWDLRGHYSEMWARADQFTYIYFD